MKVAKFFRHSVDIPSSPHQKNLIPSLGGIGEEPKTEDKV